MSTKKTAKSEAKATKKASAKKATTKKPDGKLSALDAAVKVLGESAEPMNAKSLIDAMAAKGYWPAPVAKRRMPRCSRRSLGRSM